jgi:hypothetical protein
VEHHRSRVDELRARRLGYDAGRTNSNLSIEGDDAMADVTVHRFDCAMPAALADFDVKGYVEGARRWVDAVVGRSKRWPLRVRRRRQHSRGLPPQGGSRGRLRFFIDDGLRRLIGGREWR